MRSGEGGVKRSLAVGSFDGIHLGHTEVVLEALRVTGSAELVCFEPIPRQFFGSPYWRRRLTTPGERRSILGSLGIGRVVVFPFDLRTQSSGPLEFLSELEGIGRFERLVVGYDFHFGSDRSGSAEMLQGWALDSGIELSVVPPVEFEGLPVKSERIRKLLETGGMEDVSSLLGRRYSATGPVARGRGVGRRLGFPTINLIVPGSKMLPPAGSYVAVARVRGKNLPAAAFVPAGTHSGLVEAFLPGWEGEIYGEIAAVEFVSFIRQPERGIGERKLGRLISDDVEHVMEVAREWQ
jgi:riboflavin kinase/FMN adenylyltransferase